MGSSVPQTTRMTRVEVSTSIMDMKTLKITYSTILLRPGTRYVKECYGRKNCQYVRYNDTVIPELRWLQLESQLNANHSIVPYHYDDPHASDDHPES